ncbi:hypothetical protein SNEBB_008210 [Seison nebaliae]|nr:hypothetical protein SNEBB_008210 [Seison nebaliae]
MKKEINVDDDDDNFLTSSTTTSSSVNVLHAVDDTIYYLYDKLKLRFQRKKTKQRDESKKKYRRDDKDQTYATELSDPNIRGGGSGDDSRLVIDNNEVTYKKPGRIVMRPRNTLRFIDELHEAQSQIQSGFRHYKYLILFFATLIVLLLLITIFAFLTYYYGGFGAEGYLNEKKEIVTEFLIFLDKDDINETISRNMYLVSWKPEFRPQCVSLSETRRPKSTNFARKIKQFDELFMDRPSSVDDNEKLVKNFLMFSCYGSIDETGLNQNLEELSDTYKIFEVNPTSQLLRAKFNVISLQMSQRKLFGPMIDNFVDVLQSSYESLRLKHFRPDIDQFIEEKESFSEYISQPSDYIDEFPKIYQKLTALYQMCQYSLKDQHQHHLRTNDNHLLLLRRLQWYLKHEVFDMKEFVNDNNDKENDLTKLIKSWTINNDEDEEDKDNLFDLIGIDDETARIFLNDVLLKRNLGIESIDDLKGYAENSHSIMRLFAQMNVRCPSSLRRSISADIFQLHAVNDPRYKDKFILRVYVKKTSQVNTLNRDLLFQSISKYLPKFLTEFGIDDFVSRFDDNTVQILKSVFPTISIMTPLQLSEYSIMDSQYFIAPMRVIEELTDLPLYEYVDEYLATLLLFHHNDSPDEYTTRGKNLRDVEIIFSIDDLNILKRFSKFIRLLEFESKTAQLTGVDISPHKYTKSDLAILGKFGMKNSWVADLENMVSSLFKKVRPTDGGNESKAGGTVPKPVTSEKGNEGVNTNGQNEIKEQTISASPVATIDTDSMNPVVVSAGTGNEEIVIGGGGVGQISIGTEGGGIPVISEGATGVTIHEEKEISINFQKNKRDGEDLSNDTPLLHYAKYIVLKYISSTHYYFLNYMKFYHRFTKRNSEQSNRAEFCIRLLSAAFPQAMLSLHAHAFQVENRQFVGVSYDRIRMEDRVKDMIKNLRSKALKNIDEFVRKTSSPSLDKKLKKKLNDMVVRLAFENWITNITIIEYTSNPVTFVPGKKIQYNNAPYRPMRNMKTTLTETEGYSVTLLLLMILVDGKIRLRQLEMFQVLRKSIETEYAIQLKNEKILTEHDAREMPLWLPYYLDADSPLYSFEKLKDHSSHYSNNLNEVYITPSLLSAPFYQNDYPTAYLYGTIGIIIGRYFSIAHLLKIFLEERSEMDDNFRSDDNIHRSSKKYYSDTIGCLSRQNAERYVYFDHIGQYVKMEDFLEFSANAFPFIRDRSGLSPTRIDKPLDTRIKMNVGYQAMKEHDGLYLSLAALQSALKTMKTSLYDQTYFSLTHIFIFYLGYMQSNCQLLLPNLYFLYQQTYSEDLKGNLQWNYYILYADQMHLTPMLLALHNYGKEFDKYNIARVATMNKNCNQIQLLNIGTYSVGKCY